MKWNEVLDVLFIVFSMFFFTEAVNDLRGKKHEPRTYVTLPLAHKWNLAVLTLDRKNGKECNQQALILQGIQNSTLQPHMRGPRLCQQELKFHPEHRWVHVSHALESFQRTMYFIWTLAGECWVGSQLFPVWNLNIKCQPWVLGCQSYLIHIHILQN